MDESRKLLRSAMEELAELADWDNIADDADNNEALTEPDAWPTTYNETTRTCLARAWTDLVRLDAALSRESIRACRSRSTPHGPR